MKCPFWLWLKMKNRPVAAGAVGALEISVKELFSRDFTAEARVRPTVNRPHNF